MSDNVTRIITVETVDNAIRKDIKKSVFNFVKGTTLMAIGVVSIHSSVEAISRAADYSERAREMKSLLRDSTPIDESEIDEVQEAYDQG